MDKLIDINAYPVRATLKALLQNKTTKQNIIWATDERKVWAIRPESRTRNGQRSICPWTCAAWELDKKASSNLGGLPPPNPWIPCVLGTRQPCPKSARLVRKLRGYCPAENRMIVLVGMDPVLLQPRISKALKEQQERTR